MFVKGKVIFYRILFFVDLVVDVLFIDFIGVLIFGELRFNMILILCDLFFWVLLIEVGVFKINVLLIVKFIIVNNVEFGIN